jgi:amidase
MSEDRIIRQPDDAYSYLYSPYETPIATVSPGERVVIYTADAFGGVFTSEDQRPSEVLKGRPNPQTGPILIEGAEPGDTLAVKIVDIESTRDWAISALVPYFGGLTSTWATASLQPPLEERVWRYERTPSGGFSWNGRWEVPWAPFWGTIGTAPLYEAISALTPGAHGGNMDVPDAKPGTTLYFPVHHEGAHFFVGDAHAAQGQGELCGSALEISAKGTFVFEVIKGKTIGWPRIESDDEIMAVGSARPMEDAARIANLELVTWIAKDFDFDPFDAYQILTQVGGLYVGNMVDPNYSLVATCSKDFLKAAKPRG